MPAVSKAQRRLMAAAEHGADFPLAKRLRKAMNQQQLHDFAATPEEPLPPHKESLENMVARQKRHRKKRT